MARIDAFEFPDDLFYDAREHLWLRRHGALTTIGIDDGGQDALGDVVYVQLAEPGRRVSRGEAVGSVEAAKMVRPLFAPVSGRLAEVNGAAMAKPRLVNDDPYGEGWLFRIETDEWESERTSLIQGSAPVTAWITSELAAHGRA